MITDHERFKIPDESGTFKLEKRAICNDPGHGLPRDLYVLPGTGYKHVCPCCGRVDIVTNPTIG